MTHLLSLYDTYIVPIWHRHTWQAYHGWQVAKVLLPLYVAPLRPLYVASLDPFMWPLYATPLCDPSMRPLYVAPLCDLSM